MKSPLYLTLFLALISLLMGGFSSANETKGKEQIGIEEKLGQRIPLDASFRNEEGKQVLLKDVLGKPIIVSLVYLKCSHTCPLLLGALAEVLGRVKLKPLKDYSVLTISFDEEDTPDIARDKKKNYLQAITTPFPASAWRFFTGDRENIRRFTDAAGFMFRRDESGGFAHPVALIILSPDGRIVRYLYGRSFIPFDLTMAITEADKGKIGLSTRGVLLYCFSYDQPGRRYVFNILKVFGTVMIVAVVSFFLYLTVTGRRSRSKTK
jgi:protein SCO1/2